MTIYAGETARFALNLTDEDGGVLSPLPGGVTVEVLAEDESVVGAEVAMVLRVEGKGTATGGGPSTLIDSTKAWTVDQWRGYAVRITGGTGVGQERRVKSNTATTLTVDVDQVVAEEPIGAWTTPTGSSTYEVHKADYRKNWDCPTANAGEDLVAVFRATTVGGNRPYVAAEKLPFRCEGASV